MNARQRGSGGSVTGGWTLVEALVALAVAALVLGAGAPSFADRIANAELADHAEALAGSLAFARSEAIKRGERVNLCRAAAGGRCAASGGWEVGWLVYVDGDRDARRSPDEPLLRAQAASRAGITVRANRPLDDYVSFTALGHARLISGALQMGTFTVCRRGYPAHKVVLANSGRVRVERSTDACTD